MNERLKQEVTRLYPTHTASEIAEKIGYSKGYINEVALRLNLKHNASTLQRIKLKQRECGLKAASEVAHQRSIATRLKKIEKEKRRLLSGLKPETNMRISILPKRIKEHMYYMISEYSYFKDSDPNHTVLYYDKETRRNLYAEKFTKERYGINIVNADE